MYEVKRRVELPLGLHIIDQKVAVRRHPRRLDGAQVGADDVAARVQVGELERPDAGARAEVEGALGAWAQRREEELAVEVELGDMVEEVEAVLLALVVGERVVALAEGVVAAAVFVLVGQDGGGDGGGRAGGFVEEGVVVCEGRVLGWERWSDDPLAGEGGRWRICWGSCY